MASQKAVSLLILCQLPQNPIEAGAYYGRPACIWSFMCHVWSFTTENSESLQAFPLQYYWVEDEEKLRKEPAGNHFKDEFARPISLTL